MGKITAPKYGIYTDHLNRLFFLLDNMSYVYYYVITYE